MSSSARLGLCGVLITVSTAYGLLVAEVPELAKAVAMGYVVVVVTVLLVLNLWRKS